MTCIQSWRKKLTDIGIQELVFEDAMELLLQQVLIFRNPPNAALTS